ncbi:MAG: TonB-dependent receptor plug domain-containing protein [Nitrospiria bacterium]
MGKPSVCCLLLAFACFGRPAAAPAAEKRDQTAEVHRTIIVTTPHRLEEPAEEPSGSTTILSAPEIATQNPDTAPEILRDLPGVNIKESGTIGESSVLSLRGSQPTQTLILLDGIRLNTPWRGRFDLGNFAVDEIDQVEVVRGGKSALYGSDAIGGVVQLKSARGKGPLKIAYTQEAGSESTFRERLSLSGGNKQINYSMTLARTDTNGQFSHDRFGSTSISGKTGLTMKNSGRLDLIFRYQDDQKELATDSFAISPDTIQVVFDENNEIQRKFAFYAIQYHGWPTERLELFWKAGVVDNQLDWDNPEDPGAVPPITYFEDTDTRTVVLDLQQNLRFNETFIFTFGIEQQWDEVDSHLKIFGTPFAVDRSRRNTATYAQQLIKWDKQWQLQAGVRHDDNSSFGKVTIPHFSAAYTIKMTQTRFRGSWGKGFRAPLIQDLFFPRFGNPKLRPEKSEDWEAGLQQKLGRHVIDLVYFEIDTDGLIQRSPMGVDNLGSLRTQGIEVTLELHPHPSWTLKANFSCFEEPHNCFEDREVLTNDAIPFRPWRQANIHLLFVPTVALTAALDVNWVDWQPISADFLLLDGTRLEKENPAYTRVDFSTSYHLFGAFQSFREIKLYLKVRNVLDRSYQESPGFPAPGIDFIAGLTASH